MNPFQPYIVQNNGCGYCVDQIVQPDFSFIESPDSLVARCNDRSYIVYDINDVHTMRGKVDGSKTNFQGMIGERLLSVMLEELIHETSDRTTQAGLVNKGRVLREREKHAGQGYTIHWEGPYSLRFNGRTSLVVLEKSANHPEHWYDEEKHGIRPCEIDGLAYFHVEDDKYLIIGEAKASSGYIYFGSESYSEYLRTRVITPMRFLFPEHQLIHAILVPRKIIYYDHNVKSKPIEHAKMLADVGVMTLLLPTPILPRTIEQYGQQLQDLYRIHKEKLFEEVSETLVPA